MSHNNTLTVIADGDGELFAEFAALSPAFTPGEKAFFAACDAQSNLGTTATLNMKSKLLAMITETGSLSSALDILKAAYSVMSMEEATVLQVAFASCPEGDSELTDVRAQITRMYDAKTEQVQRDGLLHTLDRWIEVEGSLRGVREVFAKVYGDEGMWSSDGLGLIQQVKRSLRQPTSTDEGWSPSIAQGAGTSPTLASASASSELPSHIEPSGNGEKAEETLRSAQDQVRPASGGDGSESPTMTRIRQLGKVFSWTRRRK